MTSFLGNALIGAGFDLPQFNASAKAMVQSALDHGKEAGKKFADGFKTSQNGQDMLDRQQFTNAIKKGMEESAQVALLGGKRVAENFVQGLEAIHSGNPEAVFSSVTRAMDNAIHVSGAAADGLVKVAGKFESLGPAAAVAGKSVEIATEAMKIFNEAGGETLSLLAQIGDSYLEASRKLAASTTNMEQLPSQLDAVREIMASGAIVHFDDVTDSLGRFQRALPLAGEQLTEFTKTYASMSELIGATSPTNIAGMLNAFTPSDAAKAKLYDYSDELTKFTNIVRATGGQTQTMVDQMIRVGPAMRALGYDLDSSALFFGSLLQQGERGTRLIYGMNQIVAKINKNVGNDPGQFKTIEEGYSSLIKSVRTLQGLGEDDQAIKLLTKYTTPANASLLAESIKKGTIADAADMGKRVGENFNQSLSEAAERTASISDAFEAFKHAAEAAIAPIGVTFASSIVHGSRLMTAWISENQVQVASWANSVAQFFLKGFEFMIDGFGKMCTGFSSWVNPAVDAVTVVIQVFTQTLEKLFKGIGLLQNIPGLSGFFKPFTEAGAVLADINDGLTKIRQTDLSAPIKSFGDTLRGFAENTIPQVGKSLDDQLGSFTATQKIETVFQTPKFDKEGKPVLNALGHPEMGTEIKSIPQGPLDAAGKPIIGPDGTPLGTDAWHPLIQLAGDAATWEKIKKSLHTLGLDVSFQAGTGIINQVKALDEQAKKTWETWFEGKTKAQVNMVVNPVDKGDETVTPDSLADGLSGGTVKVSVDPGDMSAYLKASGMPDPALLPQTSGQPFVPGSGYTSDAALLARVPKGIGQYDNNVKDLSRGLVDCTSGLEDLVNMIDGKSTVGGTFYTNADVGGAAAKWLGEHGFLLNTTGAPVPGAFNIGYNSHHAEGTLPDGTNVNFGSTESIRSGGTAGASGAFKPDFTSHYYRPMAPPSLSNPLPVAVVSPSYAPPSFVPPAFTPPAYPAPPAPVVPPAVYPPISTAPAPVVAPAPVAPAPVVPTGAFSEGDMAIAKGLWADTANLQGYLKLAHGEGVSAMSPGVKVALLALAAGGGSAAPGPALTPPVAAVVPVPPVPHGPAPAPGLVPGLTPAAEVPQTAAEWAKGQIAAAVKSNEETYPGYAKAQQDAAKELQDAAKAQQAAAAAQRDATERQVAVTGDKQKITSTASQFGEIYANPADAAARAAGQQQQDKGQRAYAQRNAQAEKIFGQTGAATAAQAIMDAFKGTASVLAPSTPGVSPDAADAAARRGGLTSGIKSAWNALKDWVWGDTQATGNAGYATGGPVFGAGTATSDSIPAYLSNGEFVHKADAVSYYGTDFMHRLNNKQLPKRGYNDGGEAGAGSVDERGRVFLQPKIPVPPELQGALLGRGLDAVPPFKRGGFVFSDGGHVPPVYVDKQGRVVMGQEGVPGFEPGALLGHGVDAVPPFKRGGIVGFDQGGVVDSNANADLQKQLLRSAFKGQPNQAQIDAANQAESISQVGDSRIQSGGFFDLQKQLLKSAFTAKPPTGSQASAADLAGQISPEESDKPGWFQKASAWASEWVNGKKLANTELKWASENLGPLGKFINRGVNTFMMTTPGASAMLDMAAIPDVYKEGHNLGDSNASIGSRVMSGVSLAGALPIPGGKAASRTLEELGKLPLAKQVDVLKGVVARPLESQVGPDFQKSLSMTWQAANTFNAVRGPMRAGAEAALSGYKALNDDMAQEIAWHFDDRMTSAYERNLRGLGDEAPLVDAWSRWIGNTEIKPGGTGYRVAQIRPQDLTARDLEFLDVQGGELLSQAVHAKPSESPTQRGMRLPLDKVNELVAKYRAGNTFSMPMSSFGDRLTAGQFALNPGLHADARGLDESSGLHLPVIFELAPGAQLGQIHSGILNEELAMGKFRFRDANLPDPKNMTNQDPLEFFIEQIGLIPGHAGGGDIYGAGNATSDSIPAWLSNGEFVHNADAVQYYGRNFMHAVNNRELPKFAPGGQVGNPLPPDLENYGVVALGGGKYGFGQDPSITDPKNPAHYQPGNPWATPPTGTQKEVADFVKSWVDWQESMLSKLRALPESGTKIAEAWDKYDNAFRAAADAYGKLTKWETERADLARKLGVSIDDPAVNAAGLTEAEHDKLKKDYITKNLAVQQEQKNYNNATDASAKADQAIQAGIIDGPPEAKASKSGVKADSNAQSLGAGLVKGIFQELGIGDLAGFTDPTQWQIFKTGVGALSYGLGLGQRAGLIPTPGKGDAAANSGLGPGTLQGIAGGALQSVIPGVQLPPPPQSPGMNVPDVAPASSVTPAMSAGDSGAAPQYGPPPGPDGPPNLFQLNVAGNVVDQGALTNTIQGTIATAAGGALAAAPAHVG